MHAGPATTVVGCHPRRSALARCARQRDAHSPRRSLCSPRLAASSGNREAKQHAMLGQGQPHGGLPNPTPTHLGKLASALPAPHGPGASGRGRLGIGKSKSHPLTLLQDLLYRLPAGQASRLLLRHLYVFKPSHPRCFGSPVSARLFR